MPRGFARGLIRNQRPDVSGLSLRRVRCRSRHCGPAVVKTRNRDIRIDGAAFRRGRAGGGDGDAGRMQVRPHGGGGCGDSDQGDSREAGNRSMSGHQNLVVLKAPLG